MLIYSFLDYLRFERVYSENTVLAYGADLAQFERFVQEKLEKNDFLEVTPEHIRDWVVTLMDEGNTAASVNRKLSTLRSFYKFLLKRGVAQVDPTSKVSGPKKKKKLPSFLREKEMDYLLDDLDFGDGFKACRDRLIIEMFYATGIRLSELIGLDDSDVDFSSNFIRVTGKRNKQRLIPFGEELKASLRQYVEIRNSQVVKCTDAFFVREKSGERLYSNLVYDLVKKNLSKVVTLKKKSPHVLRHTFATMMLNHDADLEAIKELLGHASLSATEVYTHTTFEELKKEYKQAHPRA
ncbi:MAG: tyrosine recombinase XerC [Bacteroidia bacterium]|nr:tyrosine recombinase XerC [Bacteroidia bacterium]